MCGSNSDQTCTAVKTASTTFTPPLPDADKGSGGCSGGTLVSAYIPAATQKFQVKHITFSTHPFPLILHAALWWGRNATNYLFKEINHALGRAVIKLHKCQETL